MDDFDQFERSLAVALRSDADMSVARFEPATIASAAVASTRRRSLRIAQGFSVRPASNRWPIAVAIVIGVLIVGTFLPALVGGPSPTPSTAPSPSVRGVVAPSATPSGPSAGPTSSVVPGPAGVWIATGTMSTPRTGDAVRLLDGRVLVVGGSYGDENDTSAELYDPASGTWTATGNTVKPNGGFPATLLRDGRVLAGDVDGAEVYDPVSGTWTTTGTMITANPGTATLLRDGKVLVTGHDGSSSQLYDPASGTWTATGKMITPSRGHATTLLPDGNVLVAGGFDVSSDDALDSAELYDPATGIWTAIAKMHAAKASITATLLPDGKVLVVGGADYRPPTPPELYDPANGAWTVTGDMVRPGTIYQSATLLSDGTVLVADARPYSDPPYAELYDPGTRSWITTGTMLRSHNGAPATLLLDATVLVAGGTECSAAATRCPDGATGSAELYVPAGVSPPPALPATPNPTAIPTPSPTPSPVPPEAGPVPPGGRPWAVMVVNKSSKPATLFVAEEDASGMGRLVGSVTPNAVPPGATVEVSFLLPAKGVKGWWIFVNPGPDTGALLASTEVPRAGEIRVDPDGNPGWLSP